MRVSSECNVATRSCRSLPSMLPTPKAVISPSSFSSIQRTGAVRKNFSVSGPGAKVRQSRTCGSSTGILPHSKSRRPPYFLGMFSMSMNCVRVGSTSLWERMKILEVVIGSNHFLIQPQTVGKKDGAPRIYVKINQLFQPMTTDVGHVQRCDPVSQGNELLLVCLRLAYDSSNSRTASAQPWRYQRCCSIGQRVSPGLGVQVQQSRGA